MGMGPTADLNSFLRPNSKCPLNPKLKTDTSQLNRYNSNTRTIRLCNLSLNNPSILNNNSYPLQHRLRHTVLMGMEQWELVREGLIRSYR
jgi:hypothetical protein